MFEKYKIGKLHNVDPDIVDMANRFQSLLESNFPFSTSSIFVQICKRNADMRVNINPTTPSSPKKTDVKICKISIFSSSRFFVVKNTDGKF